MFASKRRHWGRWLLLLLVLIGVGFWVWVQFFKPAPAPETVHVSRGSVIETISLSGSLEPSLFADLGFAGSGRIASVRVAEGDTVVKGQILLTLENPVAQAQYQESLIAVKIAEEQEKLARRDWDSLKKEERSKTRLSTEAARADTNAVTAQFVSNQVRAPFAGTVTRLDARSGEVVTPGTVVARAEGAGAHLVIRVNVSESEVVKLTEGMRAEVTFDALDDTVFTAELTTVSRSSIIDADVVSYQALFTLLDADQRLRDGMTADLEVKTNERQDVLTLPARAVKRREGSFYVEVYNRETNTTSEQAVQKGLEGDTGIVEVSGIAENTEVVVKNTEAK